ncbi:MAG: hypothetical protein CBC01_03255 [Betaproteobacteria bacterium TMED41]|nr:MAG: hypothetical protein CBC01_03255 [Betaproteobacteria bacterium TMED41]
MANKKKCSIIQDDSRLKLARDWINNLNISKFIDLSSLHPASEDASFRRYFRINDLKQSKSIILMDSPPNKEPIKKFINTAKIFSSAKLNVPKIFETNLTHGFLLLEDFGNETYLDSYKKNPRKIQVLLKNGISSIIQLQSWGLKNQKKCQNLSIFSKQMLFNELHLFENWYLKKHLKMFLVKKELEDLKKTFSILGSKLSEEPNVIVHRDFHSRNLMILEKKHSIGILDFQDALLGPISYDLASLLRDAYYNWREDDEVVWTKFFWENAKKQNLPVPEKFNNFIINFDFNSIQRHLKILGIFCRLAHRDNKKKFLKDLNRVRLKCIEVASKYEEFRNLVNLFEKIENLPNKNEYY